MGITIFLWEKFKGRDRERERERERRVGKELMYVRRGTVRQACRNSSPFLLLASDVLFI